MLCVLQDHSLAFSSHAVANSCFVSYIGKSITSRRYKHCGISKGEEVGERQLLIHHAGIRFVQGVPTRCISYTSSALHAR